MSRVVLRLVLGTLPAAATTSAWTAAAAQTKLAGGAGALPEFDYLRLLLALALCLVLGAGIIWWLKMRGLRLLRLPGAAESAHRLRVVETTRLHLRAMLYVVEFDGRRVLIAADRNGIFRIAESGASEARASTESVPR